MNRFCFPILIEKKEEKEYQTMNVNGTEYIEKKALDDLEDSQKLINLSVINTDKLITWISDLYLT